MISEPRPLRAARRILVRTLLIIAGIIGATVLYFLCERVFAGYPQYGTDILTYIGLTLVMATGGAPGILRHRPPLRQHPARPERPPNPAALPGSRPRPQPARGRAARA